MPRSLTQYRVFIGSPGGLNDERTKFRDALEKFTKLHAEPSGVLFHPVGWEDTLGGVGRPQGLINEDLKQCDYAVFVLHDRWGTPTGSRYSSGTEEEWELAEQLYKDTKLRNIGLFFKNVNPAQLRDPGLQLQKVLNFKQEIEAGKRYLFKTYDLVDQFCDELEGHLAKWLRDHTGDRGAPTSAGPVAMGPPVPPTSSAPAVAPDFDYWISEAYGQISPEAGNYPGALFCAEKAVAAAHGDREWARAKNLVGTAQFHLNALDQATATFSEIEDRLEKAKNHPEARSIQANALVNKGATLGQLGRNEEAIAVYEDVVARFGTASEPALREPVAKALVNKGVRLGQLSRGEEGIVVYEDVVARFGAAPEPALREPVAKALVNKGVTLGQLRRREEEIAVYEDVVARFGAAPEPALREEVATALVNKGITLGELGRRKEELAVYEDVVARFGAAPEPALREQIAKALFNKGVRLGQLRRREEEIAVYEDVVARFGAAPEPALREQVAKALFNKGFRLEQLGRGADAVAVYDDVVARFAAAPESAIREQVSKARAKRVFLSRPRAGARERK
jgi:tetratricopeptide (TPR) repeat protein